MSDVRIIEGDCLDMAKELGDHSVDLIVTSPPYAMQRKEAYGGVPTGEYTAWFTERMESLKHKLKPEGNLIVNIKEHCEGGVRSTYVLEMILGMIKCGWNWVEEYIWYKTNPFPRKPAKRLKDGWERCLHFTKNDKAMFYPEHVKVPIQESSRKRLTRITDRDRDLSITSKSGSGMRAALSKFVGKDTSFPTNVIVASVETRNKNHPAVFPRPLPEFFIKLFTKEGDLVLDPFAGSGTALEVARDLGRNSVGIEISPDYVKLMIERLNGEGKTGSIFHTA